MTEFPRLLTDRDVVVVRRGLPERVRLRRVAGRLSRLGSRLPNRVLTRIGNDISPYTATGPDMFEALVRLRRQLEPEGLMVAVQGARRDTYPSGMAGDMAGGELVHITRPEPGWSRGGSSGHS